MNGVKPWWQSSGVWGGLIAVGAPLAGLAGYQISPADQVDTISHATTALSAIGGLVAVWGRVRATSRIGKV